MIGDHSGENRILGFTLKRLTMKVILFLGLFALVSITSICQESKNKELSNAEVFSNRIGTLIQREYVDLGAIKGCKIQTAIYTDLIDGKRQRALRFEYETAGTYSDTKIAILDADEIDGLIKSIKLIQEKIFPTQPTEYTEVTFKSRSGFEAGCFKSKNGWSTYLKLEKYDGKSFVFMDKDNFSQLLTLIEKFKQGT
jgi:hypothetical protein